MAGSKDREARNFLVETFMPKYLEMYYTGDELYQQLCSQTVDLTDEEASISLKRLSDWKANEKSVLELVKEVYMRFDVYKSPFAECENIKFKLKDESYARLFYAAMCNNTWKHEDGEVFQCSWRYAGGLVAELRELGEDYLDFYCNGMRGGGGEGHVDPEIAKDLEYIGWFLQKPEEESSFQNDDSEV